MQKVERARNGATPVGDTGAASETGTKASGGPGLCAPIIAHGSQVVNTGQVALILRPGQAPEVTVTAATESEQHALGGLIETAQRLATLAGELAR